MKINVYIITVVIFFSSFSLLANNGLNQNIQASWNDIDSIINGPGYDPNRLEKIKAKIETESERLAQSKDQRLVEPMKEMAVGKNTNKRRFALSVLVKLGESEPVKQAFLELITNSNSVVGRDAIYEMAKLNKDFVREVATNSVKTIGISSSQNTLVQLLDVVGDQNTLPILNEIEGSFVGEELSYNEKFLKQTIHQARDYLEYQFNLPTEETRKSWTQQAYYYWLLPKEIEDQRYRGLKMEYYKKAELLTERGHVFSKDFLRFHLKRKDPLAVAIINRQQEKELYDDLKVYLKPNEPNSTFKELCQNVLSNKETDFNDNPQELLPDK